MKQLKTLTAVIASIALFEGILWTGLIQPGGIHTFYYREGTIIADSSQLTVLNRELRKVLPQRDLKNNLKITTTLSQKQSDDFLRISNQYKQQVLKNLLTNYPKHSSFLDSLHRKGRLSNISIIVLNNQTGAIENCRFAYSEKALFAPNLEYRATDIYGYIMTFDKGKNLSDTLRKDYRTSSTHFFPGSVSVLRSFTWVSGGSIIPRPYDDYPLSDWKTLEKKLGVTLDLSEYQPGRFSGIRTSLFDLVKTIATIQNNGFLMNPLFIRKVKNNENTCIYSHRKSPGKKILSNKVTRNMKQLFHYYMTQGPGIRNYRKNGMIEDCFLYTGGNSDFSNWMIYTNDLYTFGLVEYNILQTMEHDYPIRRREHFKLSSMMKALLSGMHLNRVKGTNLKAIEGQSSKELTLNL